MRNRSRLSAVVLAAVAMLVVGAAPVAAETVLNQCSGTCGYWEVKDTGPSGGKGAACQYETGSYDLDFISVRPPLMHGPFANDTKVQWRFKILRSTNFGGTWSTEHTSTWQTAMADDAVPAYAGNGFARRYWYAPESPTGWRKVRVYLRWKNAAGSNIGSAAVEYDWYLRHWNGNKDAAMEHCLQDW